MTEELQKCISGRTEEGFLAGEPARGLGASRRPSGDVRFTGSPARYGARTFGRCFASARHHRKNIAVQSHTKVSTLNQDLTILDYYDRQVIWMICNKYGFEEKDALRRFFGSETYRMLRNPKLEMWDFSPTGIFDLWECEQITGNLFACWRRRSSARRH